MVLDLRGGWRDRSQTQSWQEDTLVNIYSTTKGPVALAIACLVSDGLLDLDMPVVEVWPEFGAENKFDVSVRQLLSHQAGLYQFQTSVTVEDLYHWQQCTLALASANPAWSPGSGFGYHAITWGYLVGEIIRRITGMSPGSFIRQRVHPEIHIGLTEDQLIRCAELVGPNHARRPLTPTKSVRPRTIIHKSNLDPMISPFRDVCSESWRRAQIPGSNGHAGATALAEMYQWAISGELLSLDALQDLTRELTAGETDLTLGQQVRRASGFILSCDDVYFGPSATAFGHSGTGGSVAFGDPENGIAFAYVMNQLDISGSRRYRQLIQSLYDCI